MVAAPTGGAGLPGPNMAMAPPQGVQGPAMSSSAGTPQGPPVNPATGQPFTTNDLIKSGQFTANSGNYQPTAQSAPPPAPAAAPPPPAPEFMTPAMQAYVNQFQQSQTAQQQALNGALVQSLKGLGERRDAAAKVAATLPHEAQRAWQGAQNNQAQAGRDASSAFAGPTIGGNADVHQNTVRIADARHASTANQPLLQAGITADVSKGEQTLANTDMQNKAAIAQAQQQFDQQMALAQAQYASENARQAAGFSHDESMARLNSSLSTEDYLKTHPGGALTPAQQLQQQKDYFTFQKNNSPASGAAGAAGFTAGQVDQLHATPDYTNMNNVVAEVMSGKPGDKNYYGPAKGETVGAWLQKEYGNYNPDALRLFFAENPKLLSTPGPAG